MRRVAIAVFSLLLLVTVASAYQLIDIVSIQEGDIVRVTETINTTTTEYSLLVTYIDSNKVRLSIDKNNIDQGERTIYVNQYTLISNLKVYYLRINNVPFLKIYGQDNAQYSITKESVGTGTGGTGAGEEQEGIEVTIAPSPLIPGKNFYVLVDGLRYGELVVIDTGGWMDAINIKDGLAYGTLPKDVSDKIIFRIYDENDNIVKTQIVDVNKNVYGDISATIFPQKPKRGGGMVILFSKPLSGGIVTIIDSCTGLYNVTNIMSGLATFRIPLSFAGPIIIRATDSEGYTVFQTVVELSGEYIGEAGLNLILSSTTVSMNSPVTATVKRGENIVSGAEVRVEDSNGAVVTTAMTNSMGRATLNIPQYGTFKVYAVYAGKKSNELTLTVNPTLQVSVSTTSPEPGQPVTVRITKGANYEISGPDMSTITGVSDGTVEFVPPSEGTYTVKATLGDLTRTATINVEKRYIIEYTIKSGWFSKELEVMIHDSHNNPANGLLTVRKPDGSAETINVVNGYAKFGVSDGSYTLIFGGTTKVVRVGNVKSKGGFPWQIILLIAVVVLVIVYFLRRRGELSRLKFTPRDYGIHKEAYGSGEDIGDVIPNAKKLD